MLAVGAVVVAVTGRYVWRASGVVRADPLPEPVHRRVGALVRVTGSLETDDAAPLTAPFSGTRCLALRYAVEERRVSICLLPWYVTIHERSGAVDFAVDAGGESMPVSAPVHTVVMDGEVVATVEPGETPPERVEAFERRSDDLPRSTVWRDPPPGFRTAARALSLGTRRYREQRASAGDEVTVVGRLTDDGAIDPLVVSDRSPRTTLWSMARTSLGGLAAGAAGLVLGAALLAA